MTAVELDTIRRVLGGDTVLGNNSTIWISNLPMGAKRAEMTGRVALIQGYETLQKSTLTGLTINKDYCCLFMGGKGIVLVSQMKVYYGMGAIPNLVMLEKISFSLTELTTGSPELILERNTFISTTYNSIVAAMMTAGLPVTTLMGTVYSTAIGSYTTAAPGYREGQAITVAATEQIGLECSVLTTEDITTMVDFAFVYKEAYPLFVSTLNNAYKPRGTTKSKESMHIAVTDFDTEIPLPKTKISKIAPDDTVEEMITGPNGIGVFSSSTTDNYNFKFERPGYNDLWVLNKGYVAGTLIKFGVVMTKIPPIVPPISDTTIAPVTTHAIEKKDEAKLEIKTPEAILPNTAESNPTVVKPPAIPPGKV